MSKDELKSILEQHRLWDCKIAQLEAELKITDELLKEATEAIGAVVACCTYNSNDDAKIGIYGIDQKAFTRIDQFITHYNDAVSAGKVSVDVKRELTDAEIEELGAQEAERKEFCPNCEAETPCTHEAELFVCDICGEDFAKYIVLRNCTLPDVSVTRDVLISIKTPNSIENTNPDYYKDELYLDEDFRMLAKTYPADVSAIGVTTLIDYVEALEAELARRDEELAELNDRAVFIQFENEDELPADISGNVYDVMFRCSHVDGVRLFPYIEENEQKYFLVMLKEEE